MNNHRLQVARRLPVSLSCACMSAHVTKSVLVAMVIFTKEARELPYTSILTMYFLIFMMIKVLLLEVPIDIPKKQVCEWRSMRKFVCCLFTGFTPICWVWTSRVVLQIVSLFSLCYYTPTHVEHYQMMSTCNFHLDEKKFDDFMTV